MSSKESSEGSPAEIPNCGFSPFSPDSWSLFRVFRYHQAAAIPPATAEAAATSPILNQPCRGSGGLWSGVDPSDSMSFVMKLYDSRSIDLLCKHPAEPDNSDPERRSVRCVTRKNDGLSDPKINSDFCTCILLNLCYRVFIPVVEVVASILWAGSSLRHWPPGTDSSNVRAVFFCSKSPSTTFRLLVRPKRTQRCALQASVRRVELK